MMFPYTINKSSEAVTEVLLLSTMTPLMERENSNIILTVTYTKKLQKITVTSSDATPAITIKKVDL